MSFSQGVSGLTVAGRNLDVIGNNVANASTVGAKKARAEFADLYARASGGGGGSANGIGLGVSLAAVSQQFSQGSITTTDNPLDIAIGGGGFFQLKDLNNATQYSRAGQFKIDSGGSIVNNQGAKLLGFPAVNGVVQSGQVAQPLVLGTKGIEPSATTKVKVEANFDATKPSVTSAIDNTRGIPIDVNKSSSFTSATSATFYDSKGQEVPVTFLFQKTLLTPANPAAVPPTSQLDNWIVSAAVPGLGGTLVPVQVSTADSTQWNVKVTFDGNGRNPTFTDVASGTAVSAPLQFTVPSTTTSSGAFTLPFDVGTNTSNPIDFSGLTQYASSFGVTDLASNGSASGQLSQLKVLTDGTLMATYSNGKSTINFSNVLNGTIDLEDVLPTIEESLSLKVDPSFPFNDNRVTIRRKAGFTFAGSGLTFNIPSGGVFPFIGIEGLNIRNFANHGVSITDLPDDTTFTIQVCEFDSNGVTSVGDGVHVALPNDADIEQLSISDSRFKKNDIGIWLGNVDARITISSNYIGTDGSSTSDGNRLVGISISDSNTPSTQISLIQFNTISGNTGDGIRLQNTFFINSDSTISGNKVGVDNNVTVKIPNGGNGIALIQSRTQIETNDIGGNGGDGILLDQSNQTKIDGNRIGTKQFSLTTNLGNSGNGVSIVNGSQQATVSSNSIYYNALNGLSISGATTDQNEITANDYRANGGKPIRLAGANNNDPNDGDSGPNDLMNVPVIHEYSASLAGAWRIPLTYDVDLPGTYRFELYRVIQATATTLRHQFITSVTRTDVTAGAQDYFTTISLTNGSHVSAGDRLSALAVRVASTPSTNLKNTSEMSLATSPIVSRPHVVDVRVDGSGWTGLDEISFAPEVALGRQLRPIATQNADVLRVKFDSPVTVALGNLNLQRTIRNGNETATTTGITPTGFAFDSTNYIATWTFSNPLTDGKYAIHLTGVNGGGVALDGLWVNEVNATDVDADLTKRTPSLDVFADDVARPFIVGNGGNDDFRFHFSLLAGDYDRDGVVTPGEAVTGDGNGDGLINDPEGLDAAVRTNNQNDRLPLRQIQGADLVDNDRVFSEDLAQWRMYFAAAQPNSSLGDIDGDNDTDGNDLLLYQQQQNNAASAWWADGVEALQAVVGDAAPWVTNVIVSGSMSTHAAFSFDTVDGSGLQLRTVPVGGADTITIVFSEDVTVAADDLFVIGLRTVNLPTLAVFSYDAGSHAATWRFEGWALADQYLLALSDAVMDADSNNLDGEWTNPMALSTTNAAVSEFPSGDGVPGGWFTFVMTLLPGDANQDSIINSLDWSILGSNWGPGPGKLFTQADFNGDGAVNSSDVAFFYNPAIFNLQVVKLKGDVDSDGDVDDNDLNIIGLHAGMTGATLADGDANGDGSVTQADLDLAFAQMSAPWWNGLDFVA